MINKIMWNIRKKGGEEGVQLFIPIFTNWDKKFSLSFTQICVELG